VARAQQERSGRGGAGPERLKTVAKDLVEHFVGRGFTGKAMYVGIDKAAAVRECRKATLVGNPGAEE